MKFNKKVITGLILGTSLAAISATGSALADDYRKGKNGDSWGWGSKNYEECDRENYRDGKPGKRGMGNYGNGHYGRGHHDGNMPPQGWMGQQGRGMNDGGPMRPDMGMGPDMGMRMGKFIFKKYDANNDNAIDMDELAKITTMTLERYDTNSDGTISKDEADKYARNSWWGGNRKSMMKDRMMGYYDENSDGDVSKAEVESVHNKYFNLFDNNKDGKVEIAEVKDTSEKMRDFMQKKRMEMEDQRQQMRKQFFNEFVEELSKQ